MTAAVSRLTRGIRCSIWLTWAAACGLGWVASVSTKGVWAGKYERTDANGSAGAPGELEPHPDSTSARAMPTAKSRESGRRIQGAYPWKVWPGKRVLPKPARRQPQALASRGQAR